MRYAGIEKLVAVSREAEALIEFQRMGLSIQYHFSMTSLTRSMDDRFHQALAKPQSARFGEDGDAADMAVRQQTGRADGAAIQMHEEVFAGVVAPVPLPPPAAPAVPR